MGKAEEDKMERIAVAETKIESIDARTKRLELGTLAQLLCWSIVLGPKVLDLFSVAQVFAGTFTK